MIRVLAKTHVSTLKYGVRFFDDTTYRIYDIEMEDAIRFIKTYGCCNAIVENNEISFTECSISRIPILNEHRDQKPVNAIQILGCYINQNKEKIFKIVNILGAVINVSEEKLVKAMLKDKDGDNVVIVNGKLSHKGDTYYISAITGEFKKITLGGIGRVNSSHLKSTECEQEKFEALLSEVKEGYAYKLIVKLGSDYCFTVGLDKETLGVKVYFSVYFTTKDKHTFRCHERDIQNKSVKSCMWHGSRGEIEYLFNEEQLIHILKRMGSAKEISKELSYVEYFSSKIPKDIDNALVKLFTYGCFNKNGNCDINSLISVYIKKLCDENGVEFKDLL